MTARTKSPCPVSYILGNCTLLGPCTLVPSFTKLINPFSRQPLSQDNVYSLEKQEKQNPKPDNKKRKRKAEQNMTLHVLAITHGTL